MSTLGINIKKFRKAKKLTQDQIADQLGVPRSSYAQWEGENATEPKATILRNISVILEKSTEELYGEGNDLTKNDIDKQVIKEPEIQYKQNNNDQNRTLDTVFNLSESNKILAESNRISAQANKATVEAQKLLAESNAELVALVKKFSSNDHSGNQPAFESILLGLQEFVVEAAVTKYKSKEEAKVALHRKVYGSRVKKPVGSGHN